MNLIVWQKLSEPTAEELHIFTGNVLSEKTTHEIKPDEDNPE